MAPAVGFIGGMFGIGAGAAFGVAGGAAFGGWVAGAAFAGTLLGSLTVNLLGTVALGALSRALTPEPEQGGGITISSTVAGEQNPESIILGRYATGGGALCPPYSHGPSNRYLTHVIELCSAPGAQLDRIMLGEEWVELGANGLSEYGRPVLGDKYGGHVWVKYLDGSQTAADPMLRARYGNHPDRPWTADMVGHGLGIAILTFYYDQEVLAQVPRYRFELTGIPVYDIRKDSTAGGVGPQRLGNPATWTVSHNPIVLAWNIMRGIALPGGDVWGGRITDPRSLPQSVWVAAMNRCDVTIEGADGPEPMYRAGLEVLLTSPPASALEELFKACSAVFADLGHGYGVTVGAPALPVYAITDADIIVSAPEERDPFPGLDDSWNAVSAKYPDPAHFWETREAPQLTNAGYEATDTFGRRMATLSLPAAPYPAQVQRLLGPWLEDARRDLRHNITLPPDSAHVELIDSLLWTSAHNLYDGKAFTIHEIVEDPFTGLRQMAIREVDPGDYVIPPNYLLPSPPAPSIPAVIPATVDGYDVQPVTMLDAASKARRAGIRILWSPDLAGSGLRWRVRLAGQAEPILHGTIQALADGYVDLYEGVLPVTAYQVQAELIADRPTLPTAWLPVTTDDVRLSLDDLTAGVRQALEELTAWMDAYPDERADIDADIQAVHDQAMDALALAQDYLETGIQDESTARQAGLDALAAQVQTLTAVLNSQNYLQNPRFVDGTAGWTIITGAMNVIDRDEESADPIIATAPTPKFARRSVAGTGAHALEQTFDIEMDPGEVVQWRVWLTAAAVIPVQVRLFWLDDTGTQIGGAIDKSIIIAPNEWRAFSGQQAPPEGAVRLRFNIIRRSTTSTTGETAQLAVADASVTKVDVSLLARITDLEVVVANHESAQTLWQSNAESRFADAEDELDAVAVALDDRYTKAETGSAISAATTSLKSSMEGAGGSVKAAQDAAQAASNLAGSKGKVIVQSATPANDDRLAQNLWIDTTGGANTPKRWTGSAWVAVTDKVATDAAAAAASALSGLASKADASALADYYTKASMDAALANIRLDADARATQGDLVLDGVFAEEFSRWPTGTLTLAAGVTQVYTKDASSTHWQRQKAPAAKVLRIDPSDAGKWRGAGRMPVAPNEEIAVTFDIARWSENCVGVSVALYFYDLDGVQIPGASVAIPVAATVESTYRSISKRITAPANVDTAQLVIHATGSGATSSAYITNIKALRGQQIHASGALKISAETTPAGAVAQIGLRARAEGAAVGEAAVYLRALGDGSSEIIAKASGFYLFDGADETVPFAYQDGEIYLNARVTAQYMEIDRLLTFSGTGALAAFKKSANDSADGLFFGRDDAGGFVLAASRVAANGKLQQVRFAQDGFTLRNPSFYYASAAPNAVVRRTTNLAVTTLTGAKMIQITSAIGGGGGGGAGYIADGSPGTETVIELYDGPMLKQTITAAGGAGGMGNNSIGLPQIRAGESGIAPGNRGGGGNGGEYIPGDSKTRRGNGGKAGKHISRAWIDVSGWTTPRIKITIGTGGAGGVATQGSSGTAGVAGEASYQIMTAADIRANPVPDGPTASGSFAKGDGVAGNLPAIGPGHWSLFTRSSDNLNMGNITVSSGHILNTNNQNFVSFFSPTKAPPYTAAAGARTVYYLFYGMESV